MEPFVYDAETGIYWIDSWRKHDPGLLAGFTSRTIDVNIPFGNLAFHVEDEPQNVRENRKRLSEHLGVMPYAITCANQTHGNRIAIVDESLRGSGFDDLEGAIPDTDGLITHLPDTVLTLFFADCVPLFFWDPEHKVLGVAHAGWRGTVNCIAAKMVQKLQESFGSEPDTLRVAIGPSIGSCCYQVDHTVMDKVRECIPDEAEQVSIPDGIGHFRLDLRKMNQILLQKEGILSENIEVSNLCTSCNHDRFFSHRKEKGRTGRMAAFAVWKGESK